MGDLALSRDGQTVGLLLELPNGVFNLAVDGLVLAFVYGRVDEVEARGTDGHPFPFVDVADP